MRKACAGHALRSLALLEHGHPDELCVLRGLALSCSRHVAAASPEPAQGGQAALRRFLRELAARPRVLVSSCPFALVPLSTLLYGERGTKRVLEY